MKFELSFLRDKSFLMISVATALVNLFAWILIFVFLGQGNLNIILHYNVLFGIEFKGSVDQVFIIPLIGLIIFFLNAIITKLVYKREKFIAYLLLSVSLVSQIFVLIAIVAIIMINSSSLYKS
jgi:hypothetical protein